MRRNAAAETIALLKRNSLRVPLCWLLLGCTLWMVPAPALAQLPTARLFSVFPAGGKQGATIDITITGADLEEVSQLYFDIPGMKAELVQDMKDGKPVPVPAAGPAKFRVTIPADAPLGLHDVRAIGRFGVSNPRTFAVGDVIEVNETEPNNTVVQATRILADKVPGITVNGQINGATDVDYFVFQARAGQRVLVDCHAQRIDSRMNGRLTLSTNTGKLIAANDDFHDRDPFLDVTIPADGDYVIGVADQVYDGSPEYFYRLHVGTLPHIDYILPPAGTPGTTGQFTIYGRNLPGGQPAPGISIEGRPLEQLSVQIPVPSDPMALQRLNYSGAIAPRESITDGFEYRITTPQGSSNAVRLGFTTLPIVAGTEPNETPDKAQAVTTPCEIYGQFQAPRDIDWYSFSAKANEQFVFEVISQRMGFPTDAVMLLRRVSDGAEIPLPNPDDDENTPQGLTLRFAIRSDDQISTSPALAEGQYQLAVRHQYGESTGSPRFVYRLRIRPLQPDFRLLAIHQAPAVPNVANPPDSLLVRQGGNQHLDVYVVRRDGFTGEVTVQAQGLPEGVTCPPVTIGPNQQYAPLVFSAADNAPPTVGAVSITGTGTIAGQPVTREARPAAVTWPTDPNQQLRGQSRLTRSTPIAVREGAPYRIVATPDSTSVSRGMPLKLKLQITRRGDFKDQVAGIVAVTLPPNVQNPPTAIAANQNEVEVTYNLPPNTPVGTYTVAMRGNAPAVPFTKDPEGKNKQNVQVGDISTTVTLKVTDPLSMTVETPAVSVKKGANSKVMASVNRLGGYAGPVKIQLTGLPGNVSAKPVDLDKDTSKGEVLIEAAANAANGTFADVKVQAVVSVGGQNITIESPKITLTVE
jgi:hypothetical protein